METMDGMNADMARLFRAKDERRKALSRLPYPEKVRAVIKLQEMAAPILRAREKIVWPWPDSATRANKLSASNLDLRRANQADNPAVAGWDSGSKKPRRQRRPSRIIIRTARLP